MKFKKTPLFGQDSSPQNTSNILALCGTFLFWLIFVICMIFIKPNSQKPKYKEIQIILTQDFVAEKSDKNQESEKSQIQKAQESKLQNEQQIQEQTVKNEKTDKTDKIANTEQKQDNVKQPVQNENPKKQTQTRQNQQQRQQKENIPQKTENILPLTQTEPIEYAKSVEDLMAEQLSQKSRKNKPDWDSIFPDDEVTNENETPQPPIQKIPLEQSSVSGSAGETVLAGSPVRSESKKDDIQHKTSAETSTALGNIANPNSVNNSEKDKSQSQTGNKSETESNDNDNIEWASGKKRKLLNPKVPEIELESDAQSTIDNNLSVTITFTVTESGNVLPNSIKITPASMLSELVRKQIIDQISVWRFETADSVAVAEVKHNIVKK